MRPYADFVYVEMQDDEFQAAFAQQHTPSVISLPWYAAGAHSDSLGRGKGEWSSVPNHSIAAATQLLLALYSGNGFT